MSMFNDISCDGKASIFAKKFGIGQWSFIGPCSEKKWSSAENGTQGAWDNIADKMLLEFAESGCPIFRATTPLSRGNLKSKGHGNVSIQFTADDPTIETFSHNCYCQSAQSIRSHQDRSGELDVLMGQSIVLSEIKVKVPLENDIQSHQILLLQRHEERIKLLSHENKVSNSVWMQDLYMLFRLDSI